MRLRENDGNRIGRVVAPTVSEAVNLWRQALRRCDGDGVQAAKVLQRDDPVTFNLLEKSYSYEDLIGLDQALGGENLNGGGEFF